MYKTDGFDTEVVIIIDELQNKGNGSFRRNKGF
jgi:hypothetical protein